ncbi:hypothetical protein C1646_749333 [Rhizophagus diaphanus]|nr:hypothetical protein C1646_749333 [Rhizophagus diaphanus] [Rhizophagus sp. MUCL 43196]
MEQTYSDTSVGDKIEVYEFLEALGLLDNEVAPINMDDDDNNKSDIDEENNTLKKLYQVWEARHQNISNAFGVKEHNALLDALANLVKGSDLNNY